MLNPLASQGKRIAQDRVDLTVPQYSAYQGEVYAALAESLQNEAILEARTSCPAGGCQGRRAGVFCASGIESSPDTTAELPAGLEAPRHPNIPKPGG
jgi:hypothetical protein